MNEKATNRRPWLIAGAILLAWAVGATVFGVQFYGKYRALQSDIAAADGGGLLESVRRHGEAIIAVHDGIVATGEYIRDADRDARATDVAVRRAYELAKSSDDRFVEFGNSMEGVGGTIHAVIARQQRIDELIRASQADNRAIKAELGMCLGEDN